MNSSSNSLATFLRFNSHWHALILEGGFDAEGQFVFLSIHDTRNLPSSFPKGHRAVSSQLLSVTLCDPPRHLN